jgi:alcohol dehydrogenase, propanol-preferring
VAIPRHRPTLTWEEVPDPHAGPGEVVVDVKAAGLCHSDVGALQDPKWMQSFPRIPMTLGHENAGVISEVGPGMDEWKVGDRVGLDPVMPDGDAIGYGAWDGGYGPKVRATGANLVRLPDELSFEMGAMATDSGITSYHAMVTAGGLEKGMRVGVTGLGGLGYIGARVAILTRRDCANSAPATSSTTAATPRSGRRSPHTHRRAGSLRDRGDRRRGDDRSPSRSGPLPYRGTISLVGHVTLGSDAEQASLTVEFHG